MGFIDFKGVYFRLCELRSAFVRDVDILKRGGVIFSTGVRILPKGDTTNRESR